MHDGATRDEYVRALRQIQAAEESNSIQQALQAAREHLSMDAVYATSIGSQQQTIDAVAGDVGAMRLVRRRIKPELHRADDAAVELGREQHRFAGGNGSGHPSEEFQSIMLRERRHEADAGATCDAIDQHGSEFVERAVGDRRFQGTNVELGAHAARSSFEATVESALR